MAKKWQIDEAIKIFGCQNLKNSSLYNGEEEFIKIMVLKIKKIQLYIMLKEILKIFGSKPKKVLFSQQQRNFLKKGVEVPKKDD